MRIKKRFLHNLRRRNVIMAENRYVGSYPVIGIRPTIDGRKGALDVRGSLEEQTMNMAKNAAKLFEENLRYSNGEPVKVVIADSTIGRVGESAACADKFRKEGVDITLTVTPCWCYGSETMDMDPTDDQGSLGTERDREAGRCIPCFRTRNTRPERSSGIRHLRP